MNHPKREQWVPYLFGEADPESRRSLAEHFQACAQCRQEFETWKRSVRALDGWRLPSPRAPLRVLEPALKWAIAAGLVLGLGFELGRSTANAKAEVRRELESDLMAALARDIPPAADGFQRRFRGEWQQAIQRVNEKYSTAPAEQQYVTALFDQLRQQENGQYLSLRRDLETLASVADERLTQNRRQIVQLASQEPAEQP